MERFDTLLVTQKNLILETLPFLARLQYIPLVILCGELKVDRMKRKKWKDWDESHYISDQPHRAMLHKQHTLEAWMEKHRDPIKSNCQLKVKVNFRTINLNRNKGNIAQTQQTKQNNTSIWKEWN